MANPCIICVAITGSVPTKANNPALPVSLSEQIESTQESFEAGASIAHCHVRNDDQTPTVDPQKYVIVQLSTGGRSGSGRERGGMLSLRPDMASLAVGSNNFPTRVYENSPDLVNWLAGEMQTYHVTPEIEAFDLSHILQGIRLHDEGALHGNLYIQFVMGVKNAMPADKTVFDFYVSTVQSRAPYAQWCGAGIGAAQLPVNEWSIAAGGHTRTGMEDNVRLDRHTLAPSNAALVQRAAQLCEKYERPVASWEQARELLGVPLL